MMKKLFIIIFFLLLLLITYTCTEDDKIITPPQDDSNIRIISLSHLSARQGEKVTAFGKNLDSYNLLYVEINNEKVEYNRTSDTTLSLFIPYNGSSGQFVFYFYSQTHDTVLTSPRITITDYCVSGLCIDWNTKDKIYETDSWIKAFANDSVKWNLETVDDTLFFKRNGHCHDECGFWHTIAFKKNQNTELPEFLFSVYKKREWLVPDFDDTLKYGVIRIDQWDSTSVYSGTFSFENYNWIFWVKN